MPDELTASNTIPIASYKREWTSKYHYLSFTALCITKDFRGAADIDWREVGLPNFERHTFDYVRPPNDPYIIPPIAAKIDIAQKALRERWYKALHLSTRCSGVGNLGVFISDELILITQVLFRTALKNNRKPKPVIVVNPDYSVANRVREVCQKVKIEHYPSIERLLLDNTRMTLTSNP